ncbi:MAG: hypothetical protein JWO82_2254, partial [Akkermansiaceae bacterium]|nr:hypothetical protein [Akkermansiaceae bacterium]
MIDDELNHDTPRTAEEIAQRALILHCVIAAGHDVEKIELVEWLESENLWPFVSPRERRFLMGENITQGQINYFIWRIEAQVALLWAISKTDSLGTLVEPCKSASLVAPIPPILTSTAEFISTARLRTPEEIEEAYEYVYDAHCRMQDPGSGKPVHPAVILQRHYAFNWIIGDC